MVDESIFAHDTHQSELYRWKGVVWGCCRWGLRAGALRAGKHVWGKSVVPTPQVLCSPGVTEDTREYHDAVRQTTSQDADPAAAALSESLFPREVPGAGSVHIPGLAGVLAGWGPCCHELWSRLNLGPSQSRWSLRCGSSSRGREAYRSDSITTCREEERQSACSPNQI